MRRMNLRALLVAATVCALTFNGSSADAAPSRSQREAADRASIQKVFAQYREALTANEGSKAADLVSARTIVFYDEIVSHALKMPREKMGRLDFVAKFTVLRVRHEFDKAEIEKMTGRQLFILGVDRGWISKSSVASIGQLTEIKVDQHQAAASIAQAPGIPAFHFVNESGQWKLDLILSFQLANDAMGAEIAKTGMTEEEFIVRALNMLSSKKFDDRVFSGPLE